MKPLVLLLAIFAFTTPSMAGKKQSKEKLQTMGAQLGTDHKFSGLSIGGRYQSANMGLSTVENEKPIFDLLDYDKNFSSRSAEARSLK